MAIPCDICGLPAIVGSAAIYIADALGNLGQSVVTSHPECYEQRKMDEFRHVLRDHPTSFEMLGSS